jgi:m7GpppX diphosphatase
MELTYKDTKKQFIPTEVLSFANIRKIKLLLQNDAFEKWEAITEIKGEFILCNDTTKLAKRIHKIKKETYEEYLEFIENRDINKDRWIYNILDGLAEQEKILYRDELCVVIPTYTWDSKNINKLHILCMPIDKNLRTIRDLTEDNIPLLEHMKKVTLEKIEKLYQLKIENLKIFLHYDPSTYHLHIHFINVEHVEAFSSVEYSHDLDIIIFNLKLYSDYYKKIKLNIRK